MKKAFTLIEIVVIVLIVSVMVGASLPYVQSYVEESRQAKVKSDLEEISKALAIYESREGEYTKNTIEDLVGRYLDHSPVDPWGVPYFIATLSKSVYSLGPDRKGYEDGEEYYYDNIEMPYNPPLALVSVKWLDKNKSGNVDAKDELHLNFSRKIAAVRDINSMPIDNHSLNPAPANPGSLSQSPSNSNFSQPNLGNGSVGTLGGNQVHLDPSDPRVDYERKILKDFEPKNKNEIVYQDRLQNLLSNICIYRDSDNPDNYDTLDSLVDPNINDYPIITRTLYEYVGSGSNNILYPIINPATLTNPIPLNPINPTFPSNPTHPTNPGGSGNGRTISYPDPRFVPPVQITNSSYTIILPLRKDATLINGRYFIPGKDKIAIKDGHDLIKDNSYPFQNSCLSNQKIVIQVK